MCNIFTGNGIDIFQNSTDTSNMTMDIFSTIYSVKDLYTRWQQPRTCSQKQEYIVSVSSVANYHSYIAKPFTILPYSRLIEDTNHLLLHAPALTRLVE